MNDEDFSAIEQKALKSGAVKAYVVDLQVRSFYLCAHLPIVTLWP